MDEIIVLKSPLHPSSDASLPAEPPPELSIVMPCFNEAGGIEQRVQAWVAFAESATASYELVLINDGSSDGTGRILDKLRKEMKGLRVIHQLNGGHARAIRRGYELARGAYVLQVDSNGLYLPDDFAPLWERRHRYELLLGYRTNWVEGSARRGLLRLVRWWVSFLFGSTLRDPNVPFRLFRREIAANYLQGMPADFEGVNLALSVLFLRDFPQGIYEVPVPDRIRTTLPSRLTFRQFLSLMIHYLTEISQIRFARRLNGALPPAALPEGTAD